jgi:hypothetical protein
MMMRRKAAMQRPMQPPMEDPENMDTMMYPGGDEDMEMNDAQGTVPMPWQGQAPPQNPMAVPVHSTPEMQSEYKRMGFKGVTPEATDLTRGFEQAPAGPIREKFHAAQHQRLKNDQHGVNQQLRMELANKKAMIEAKILQMNRLGDHKGAARLQQSYEGMVGQLDALINSGMQAPQ